MADATLNTVPKQFLAAYSLASLLFLRIWFELNHLHHEAMHKYWLGRAPTMLDYAVAVAGALLLALLLLPLIRAMQRRDRPRLAAACAFIVMVLLGRSAYLALGISELLPELVRLQIQDAAGALWLSGATAAGLFAACVLLVWLGRSRQWLVNSGPVLGAVLVILFPYGIAAAATALNSGFRADDDFPAVVRSAPDTNTRVAVAGAPRVIVMVFDELDYRLAFESSRGPELKGLSRLRASSLFATQAFPPSNATAISMPALLMGERLQNIRTDRRDGLDLFREDGSVVSFGDSATLVHRAVGEGHRVALIGWYHAYCRLFTMASDCLDSPGHGHSTSYPATDAWEVMIAQWRQVVPFGSSYAVSRYENSVARFRRVLADPSLGLVFAHFSIPHGPVIFDASTGKLTNAVREVTYATGPVGYFSNLMLVDRLVDETMDAMQAGCRGCILVVTSDHWWRWARRYDGRTDRRVPFAVYMPGESGSTLLGRKFNTEFLAHLVMAMLRGEPATRADIARWIERHGRPRDPVSAPWMDDEDRMATSHDPPGMPH